MRSLVAYCSKTGTTEEIAKKIGEVLRSRGIEADVSPVASVVDIGEYDSVVLGSPVNAMRVLPEFREFATSKAPLLTASSTPVDLFIVSYIHQEGRKFWKKAVEKDASGMSALLGAKSTEIFGGRLPGPLPGFPRFIFGTPKNAPLDLRNWPAIEAWAGAIADRMLK